MDKARKGDLVDTGRTSSSESSPARTSLRLKTGRIDQHVSDDGRTRSCLCREERPTFVGHGEEERGKSRRSRSMPGGRELSKRQLSRAERVLKVAEAREVERAKAERAMDGQLSKIEGG